MEEGSGVEKNVWAIKTILKIIKKPIAKVTSFFSTGV